VQDLEDFPDDSRDYRRGRAVAAWQPKLRVRHRRELEEQERRQRYAAALARAELGRFYWSGERDSELKAAINRRPKQRKSNGARR
jgi:hypothetical protein